MMASKFYDDDEPIDPCEQFGCDPWDDENFGRHYMSRAGLASDGGAARERRADESVDDYLDALGVAD